MKTTVQATLETGRGVRLTTPQLLPTYLQTKVVELYWQGYSDTDISYLLSSDVDFVSGTIERFAI